MKNITAQVLMKAYQKKQRGDTHYFREIAGIYGKVKRSYRLFKFIDRSYLRIHKEDGFDENNPIPFGRHHSKFYRDALCSSLFRNIVLELYSIFYDNRGDVIAITKFIIDEKPSFFKEYEQIYGRINLYRNKILAHKEKETSPEIGYGQNHLDELMLLSEKIIDWYFTKLNDKEVKFLCRLEYSSNIINKEERNIMNFLNRISNLSIEEVFDEDKECEDGYKKIFWGLDNQSTLKDVVTYCHGS